MSGVPLLSLLLFGFLFEDLYERDFIGLEGELKFGVDVAVRVQESDDWKKQVRVQLEVLTFLEGDDFDKMFPDNQSLRFLMIFPEERVEIEELEFEGPRPPLLNQRHSYSLRSLEIEVVDSHILIINELPDKLRAKARDFSYHFAE